MLKSNQTRVPRESVVNIHKDIQNINNPEVISYN